MRDGQTSPHRLRLVVSRSTCPPLSPSPHANSFIIGTAVINTHTHRCVFTPYLQHGPHRVVSRRVPCLHGWQLFFKSPLYSGFV
jgi:hypothetical protein